MADEQSSQEKTEDATPRRMREARKKGQVAKSRDLNTVIILIGACAALAAMLVFIGDQMQLGMQQAFHIAQQRSIDDREIFHHIRAAAWLFLKAIGPFLAIVTGVAVLIGFLQVGPVFSAEPVHMQPKRLNIVENIKNMAKVTTLVELLKNVLKIILVFLIAYLVMKGRLGDVLKTMTADPQQAAAVAADVLEAFLIWIFVCFLAIALIDLAVQRWQHQKQLRMSKDEVKREYKQDEGDPLIKAIRRQLQQEMAMGGDTRSAVAASDVVITNPTHVAVAVKYNQSDMAAPQIMAKGMRNYAQLIRELAEEHQIPIMRNVPLAWSLIELEVGDEIPESLYQAVAELLLIVYKMKDGQQGTDPGRQ